MTYIKLVLARYLHKPMSTMLSIFLFAVGVAVISLVVKSEYFIENNYSKNLGGIDLVVGAKGSPLQLILSTVLHVDVPTGNIPLDEVEKVKKNPLVKSTIPLALGDNYDGYRIVGTTHDYADIYNANVAVGKMFSDKMEVVIGANVAKATGLKLNDHFAGMHGYSKQGHIHKEFKYTVTGILAETGSVMDNLILTPVESVWYIHEHHHHHHHDGDDEDGDDDHHDVADIHEQEANEEHHHVEAMEEIMAKVKNHQDLTKKEMRIYNTNKGILQEKEHHPEKELTALLVFYRNPMAALKLPRMINENTSMQAAAPAYEFSRLLSILDYGITILKVLAWIIIIISGINIFIFLLNSINQTIGEIALLRATGVSRTKVLIIILLQGILLAVFGWITGIILANIIWLCMPWVNQTDLFTSFMIQKNSLLLLYCIIVSFLAGIIPAIKIYNTKVHYLLNKR